MTYGGPILVKKEEDLMSTPGCFIGGRALYVGVVQSVLLRVRDFYTGVLPSLN
jgi:hypothetical protein